MNKNKTRHNSLAEFFNIIRVTHIHFLDDIERDSLSLKFDLHSFAEFFFVSTLAPLVPLFPRSSKIVLYRWYFDFLIVRKIERNDKMRIKKTSLTHFMPLVFYDTHWKHRKSEVFWCFQGYRKRPVVWNGLKRNRL